MTDYEKSIEIKMQRLFATLSEKDWRRYAGIEAAKLGHGGIDYVSGLFEMDPKTVHRGLTELELPEAPRSKPDQKKKVQDVKQRGIFANFSICFTKRLLVILLVN